MFCLLNIFVATNMNCISWGTRESSEKQKKTQKAGDANNRQSANEQHSENKGHWLTRGLCCNMGGRQSAVIDKLNEELQQVKVMIERMYAREFASQQQQKEEEQAEQDKKKEKKNSTNSTDPEVLESIDEREKQFWNELIERYLKPLEEEKPLDEITDETVKKIKDNRAKLNALRNKTVFVFGFLNLIFITLVYMFELHNEVFYFPIKLWAGNTMLMEPAGLCVLVCFGVTLVFQLIGEIFCSLPPLPTIK